MSVDIVKKKVVKVRRPIRRSVSATYASIVETRAKIRKAREQLDSLERTVNELEARELRATQN